MQTEQQTGPVHGNASPVPVHSCVQRVQASLESGALQTAPDLRGVPSGDQEAVQKLQLERHLASLQQVCTIMCRYWDFMV